MAKVEIWTVYDHPSDYPDMFVARKFIMDKPTDEIITANTLESLRKKLPQHLTKVDRDFTDDINIVESWI